MEAFGIPGGALRGHAGVLPERPRRDGLRGAAGEERDARRHGRGHPGAGGPGERHPAGAAGLQPGRAELCDEFGALLIFDEVVTGFRLGLGGAQGYFERAARPDRVRQVRGGRLPGRGRPGRAARGDGVAWPPGWRRAGRARLRRRDAVGQPDELRGGLLRPAGDGGHRRAGEGGAGRRPAVPRAASAHRAARPAVRGLQPRLDRPPGDVRRAAGGHDATPTRWPRASRAS